MEQGYGTGLSRVPINFGTAGLAYMQSAIKMRQAELQNDQTQAANNEKMILKALDFQSLGDLASKQRETYSKEIDNLKQNTVKLMASRQGKLTSADRMEIEKQSADLQNKINAGKNALQKFEATQKFVQSNLNTGMFTDNNAVLQSLTDTYSKIEKGEAVDPSLSYIPFLRVPTASERIGHLYKNELAGIRTIENQIRDPKDPNKYVLSKGADPKDIERFVNDHAKDPEVISEYTEKDPTTGEAYVNLGRFAEDVGSRLKKDIAFRWDKPRATTGGSGSYNPNTSIVHQPETGKIYGEDFGKYVRLNSDSKFNVLPEGATELGTNKPLPAGTVENVQVVAVAPEKGYIIGELKGHGGVKKRGVNAEKVYKTSDKDVEGITASEITDADVIALSNYPEGTVESILSKRVTEDKNGLHINAAVKLKGKKESVPMPTIDLQPDASKDYTTMIKIPLTQENIGMFSRAWGKHFIKDDSGNMVPLSKYMNEAVAPKTKTASGSEDWNKYKQ